MSPALAVLIAWLVFGGSHLLLSAPPLRDWLSAKLGASRFIVFYALIAAISMSLLIATVAYYGGTGPAGLDLSAIPALRWILGAVALFGAGLAVAGIVNYPRSAIAVLARRWRASKNDKLKPLPPLVTVERITRHPFFVGLALLMIAHALMANTLASAVYFAGFAALALIGIPMQDRKLHKRHGDLYRDYMQRSSVMPFAASDALRGVKFWDVPFLIAFVIGAIALAALHPVWRVGHGATFAAAVLAGGLYAVAKQSRSGRNRS